jgi:hypothetical protein
LNKNLTISQILVYYDYPEIFSAIDDVGTNYVCLLINTEKDVTNYVATAISVKRFSEFINGKVDLRDIYESPEVREWYTFSSIAEPIKADIWKEQALRQEFLPERGFLYQKPLSGHEVILKEVIENRNAVIHLAVSDEEDNYSIDADNLGNIVKLYQSIIENSFKKALVQRNIKEKKSYFIPQNYKLRAFASSQSSFNLHLYSTSQTDLFGNSMIELGLEKFDEITKDFENDDILIESLRTVKGHTISSLKKLVKTMIDNKIKIKHKWFAPNRDVVHFTVIDKNKAEKLYNILNLAEELAEETRVFIGSLVQVDVEKGTWRINNLEDGKEYSGEAIGQILQGVTVETVNYKLTCLETIEELKVSEKEKVRYVLKVIEKA